MYNPCFRMMMTDDAALEAFIDMRNAQPPSDRLHYFDKALEGSAETNAVLFQKLYTDILSKSNLDYGAIPDSKGMLIKYKGYPLMEDSINKINALYEGTPSDIVTTMNKLHEMILNCKSDYNVGFTYDIEIIKVIYNVSVLTLYELINLCIVDYTKIMRKNAKIEFGFAKKKKDDIIVLKNAKSLVKMYESGQWGNIMRQVKKDPSMLNGVAPTTEAVSIGALIAGIPGFIKYPIAIVAGVIFLFVIIRQIIYWFYYGANKVKDYANTQQKFVDAVIDQEVAAGESQDALQKHHVISDKLRSIANFIEVKILHTDKDAKNKLVESNKNDFNARDFKPDATPTPKEIPSPSPAPAPIVNPTVQAGNVASVGSSPMSGSNPFSLGGGKIEF